MDRAAVLARSLRVVWRKSTAVAAMSIPRVALVNGLDSLAEYRTGPMLLEFVEEEAAGRVGLTSHFALGSVGHILRRRWNRRLQVEGLER